MTESRFSKFSKEYLNHTKYTVKFVATGDGLKTISIPENTIIDSSGAGDGFNAAYLSEFITSQNVVKSLKAGHNMGSKIVMKKGAIIL